MNRDQTHPQPQPRMDTNLISNFGQAAPAVQQAFNAWLVVAAGAGAALAHAYHVIVAGGGLKYLARRLWTGDPPPPPPPAAGSPRQKGEA